MTFDWASWTNLAIRWLHLTAGIAWIGSSFYFMWLDSHLKKPPKAGEGVAGEGVAGELWSVHSGGFYRQIKFMVAPSEMPEELHWFKWEAYTTWMSGFLLLALIFYVGADLNLIDKAKFDLASWQAITLGLGSLVAGWLVYDGLCRSPVGQDLKVFGVVWFVLLTAAGWGLTRVFSDLGAFMHLGAIIGTVMAANVFLIIIPNQRKVVAQVLAGEAPDPSLGKQAKQRSVHNNYMTLPVLFIMISNHYPMIFGAPLNWLYLAGLGFAGCTIRHFFNLKNAGRFEPQVLIYGAAVFLAVAALNEGVKPKPVVVASATYAEARAIVDRHCTTCHAARPTHRGVPAPPNGAAFDTAEQLQARAQRIYERAVATRSMPLGNETGMTDRERAVLGAWIGGGAKVEFLMREVTPQPLTADAFAPFGDVIEAAGEPIPINYGQTQRFDDLAGIDVADGGGRAIVSLFRSKPLEPLVLEIFERHPLGSQAFVPLQGRPYLVAVAPAGAFDPAAVRVFRADPSQGVNYAKGVWHHYLLALEAESDFLVVDRAGPGENLHEVRLSPDDAIRVRP